MKVPTTQTAPTPPQLPPIPKSTLLMTAALMHEQGRLNPKAKPTVTPVSKETLGG